MFQSNYYDMMNQIERRSKSVKSTYDKIYDNTSYQDQMSKQFINQINMTLPPRYSSRQRKRKVFKINEIMDPMTVMQIYANRETPKLLNINSETTYDNSFVSTIQKKKKIKKRNNSVPVHIVNHASPEKSRLSYQRGSQISYSVLNPSEGPVGTFLRERRESNRRDSRFHSEESEMYNADYYRRPHVKNLNFDRVIETLEEKYLKLPGSLDSFIDPELIKSSEDSNIVISVKNSYGVDRKSINSSLNENTVLQYYTRKPKKNDLFEKQKNVTVDEKLLKEHKIDRSKILSKYGDLLKGMGDISTNPEKRNTFKPQIPTKDSPLFKRRNYAQYNKERVAKKEEEEKINQEKRYMRSRQLSIKSSPHNSMKKEEHDSAKVSQKGNKSHNSISVNQNTTNHSHVSKNSPERLQPDDEVHYTDLTFASLSSPENKNTPKNHKRAVSELTKTTANTTAPPNNTPKNMLLPEKGQFVRHAKNKSSSNKPK